MISGICPFCQEPITARNGCVVCLRKRNFQHVVGNDRLFLAFLWVFWISLAVGGLWLFWFLVCWLAERGGR